MARRIFFWSLMAAVAAVRDENQDVPTSMVSLQVDTKAVNIRTRLHSSKKPGELEELRSQKLEGQEEAKEFREELEETLGDKPAAEDVGSKATRCMNFETTKAPDGLPMPIEAMMFGIISQITLPIGAGMGILHHPVATETSSRTMALGAGALVFAVATQIFGNSLFALLAVSRKYGPFDKGCEVVNGESVCKEKFWNMIIQCMAALIGAFVYCALDALLKDWSRIDHQQTVMDRHAARKEPEDPISGLEPLTGTEHFSDDIDIAADSEQLRTTRKGGSKDVEKRASKYSEKSAGSNDPGQPTEENMKPIPSLLTHCDAVTETEIEEVREGSGSEVSGSECHSGESQDSAMVRQNTELIERSFAHKQNNIKNIHAVVGSNVALSIWLGCMLDSIPSAIMIGLLTNRYEVSYGFLFALSLSSYPSAYSGASLLLKTGMAPSKVMLMWTALLVVTGLCAMLTSLLCPLTCAAQRFSDRSRHEVSFAEGFSGGLLLTCLATALMPAAYAGAKHSAGIYFVVGFIIAILFEALNAYLPGAQETLHEHLKAFWVQT